jgi:hypothetical protein
VPGNSSRGASLARRAVPRSVSPRRDHHTAQVRQLSSSRRPPRAERIPVHQDWR